MYKAPCGFTDSKEYDPEYAKMTCQIIGCRECRHFNGTIYYESDITEGLSEWAKLRLKGRRER